MIKHRTLGLVIAGSAAGIVNGLLGTGGGMVLIPLLELLTDLDEASLFTSSVAVILPLCLVSLICCITLGEIPLTASLPWLIGSGLGGFLAGKCGKRIPVPWLHKGLGILILWGGFRCLF